MFISLPFLTLIACNDQSKSNSNELLHLTTALSTELEVNLQKEPESNDMEYQDLMKYIGKYPKQTDFFDNPIMKEGLKKILKNDFKSYLEFVSLAGCGEMNYKYGLIYGDISQLHVGGYSSLIFIDVDDKKLFLFWLKETGRR